MRGQGEYIAAIVLTMIIILIATLATNWTRYIENTGRIQVINVVKSKERLTVVWPYRGDRNKALIVNQWDGNSEIRGLLIVYRQKLFTKTLDPSYNNMSLSIASSRVIDLKSLGLDSNNLNNIDRICFITVLLNLFCNEYIPTWSISLYNVSFKISSSSLRIHVSSYDIITSMYAFGYYFQYYLSDFYPDVPPEFLAYGLAPYLPAVPTVFVYAQGDSTTFYADASRKNFTVIVSYNNGVPQLVSAYLDGVSYRPIDFRVLSSPPLFTVDGIPFRILNGYTGVAMYRADIYYAYISSYDAYAKVYVYSVPVRLEPFDEGVFTRMIYDYKNLVGVSPALLATYTLRKTDGLLKLDRIILPKIEIDLSRLANTHVSYVIGDVNRMLSQYWDLSGYNIYISPAILKVPRPSSAVAPPSNAPSYNVVGQWRDIFNVNVAGSINFVMKPYGKGVWANVTELKYMSIATDLASQRRYWVENVRLHPVQWVFTDWNSNVVGSVLFRFATVAMVNPDNGASHIIDYIGYFTKPYVAVGAIYRTPIPTPTTTHCLRDRCYVWYLTPGILKTTASQKTVTGATVAFFPRDWNYQYYLRSKYEQYWISIVFLEGGFVWIDYEFLDALAGFIQPLPEVVELIKCPFMDSSSGSIYWWYMCYARPPSYLTQPLAQPFNIVILGSKNSEGEPWENIVYMVYQGGEQSKTLTYRIVKWVYNPTLTTWTSTIVSTSTVVQNNQINLLGTQTSGQYNYWIIEVWSGTVTRIDKIQNFNQPPYKLDTATFVLTTTTAGTTRTITTTITYWIPAYPPQYFRIFGLQEYLMIIALTLILLLLQKLWKKLSG